MIDRMLVRRMWMNGRLYALQQQVVEGLITVLASQYLLASSMRLNGR
jgi:hypothetical protein